MHQQSIEPLNFSKIPMDELIFHLEKLRRLLNYESNLESQIFFSIKFHGFPNSMNEERKNEIVDLLSK